jgi:2-oxoisovalerate dehydrogenase E1 component subunit alpha
MVPTAAPGSAANAGGLEMTMTIAPHAPVRADGSGASPAVQLLAPDGGETTHPRYPVSLTGEQYRSLYRDMTLTRCLDTEATMLQRQGELGLWIPSLGQEGAQIGAAHALGPADYVFPAYREHGLAWCRGVDPVDLLRMFRGTTNGGWDTRRHRFHLYTIVVGAQTLHAAGYAMGMARDGEDGAVLACFGDGAASQGDVNEAFTFAAVFNAPVVFFCQNNQWAISVPAERQARVPVAQRAAGFGFPGIRVDGNDVLACLTVVGWALEHARSGNGPVLVEALTYRMGPHTTSDDPSRYRDPAEAAEWAQRDPITRLRRLLDRRGLADEQFLAGLDAEAAALSQRIRDGVTGLPDPPADDLFRHVYAEPHPLVEEERAEYQAFLSRMAQDG